MYRSSIRFNEKELSYFAINLDPDKEGLLEKKGAGLGQGYKQRWFRLKGNLLFYFKVDELQDWESTGDPVGVIVLERFKVENTHNESQPFSFALTFEGDDSRTYMLKAYSKQEQQGWIEAIGKSSYEKLKFKLYSLQEEYLTLTGKDPLMKHQGFSGKSPLSKLPPHLSFSPSGVRRLTYRRPSQKAKAQLLKSSAQQQNAQSEPQCFLFQLKCSNLPHLHNGKPPNTMVHVFYNQDGKSTLLASTEVVESSTNPSYWHHIPVQIDPKHCWVGGSIVFKVVSIHQDSITGGRRSTSSSGSTSSEEECSLDTAIAMGREEIIGSVNYSVRNVVTIGVENCVELKLDKDGVDRGLLTIHIKDVKKFHEALKRQPTMLSEVSRSSVWSHYLIPVSDKETLTVTEELSECLFNILVPLELLKCLRRQENLRLDELNYNIGALSESWQAPLRVYQTFLFQSVALYQSTTSELEQIADSIGFKPTSSLREPNLQFLALNLHIQKLHVCSNHERQATAAATEGQQQEKHTYNIVTMGSPSYHTEKGPRTQGLKSVISELKSCPSFVSKGVSSSANLVKAELTKLGDIRSKLEVYKNALFMSAGNAKQHEMNTAFTGISTEVQKLLALTQSSIVLEAIGDLIRARPGNPMPSFTISSINTSSAIPVTAERRNLTLRKKSPGFKRIGCCCGKCTRCLPSPSDWLWNGSHYVQVSTGEWKLEDSTASIQELLVRLLDKVEEASKKVVELQHEAHASSTDTTVLTTFKPTYVWSQSLIPAVNELDQTVEGLMKLAHSSLSFSLMKLDSCEPNLLELRKHMDIVFCQALTGLVTSFYITLNEHFTDAFFMKQLEKLGFLAHFECLLGSTGEELAVLEDMYIGVSELKNVKFQLSAVAGSDIDFDFRIIGTREKLIVQFLISRDILTRLPNEHIRLGHSIKVVPLVIAYGMNEAQGRSMGPLVKLQEEINHQGLEILSKYVEEYKILTADIKDTYIEKLTLQVREQFRQLKTKYDTHKSKNIEFLISAEQLSRKLKSGRLTTCRTGKDRSSMAVTLEECCLLRTEHKLKDSSFMRALSSLRSTGTQLENCFKNTGCRCYHFNTAQYQMLPRILQPPRHTCRHSIID